MASCGCPQNPQPTVNEPLRVSPRDASKVGSGVKLTTPSDTTPEASALRKDPRKRSMNLHFGVRNLELNILRNSSPVPTQFISMSAVNEVPETNSNISMLVVSRAVFNPRSMENSVGESVLKPSAKNSDSPVQKSKRSMKTKANLSWLQGPGGLWNLPSFANTPTKVATPKKYHQFDFNCNLCNNEYPP